MKTIKMIAVEVNYGRSEHILRKNILELTCLCLLGHDVKTTISGKGTLVAMEEKFDITSNTSSGKTYIRMHHFSVSASECITKPIS